MLFIMGDGGSVLFAWMSLVNVLLKTGSGNFYTGN
jgi:hypothetical protein